MILIQNAHIMPIVGPELPNGCLLAEDGRITAVAPHIDAPEGCTVIDADGRLLTPGCVEAHCHIGLDNECLRWEGMDYNEIVDPLTPQLRAIDSINPQDGAFPNALRGGVTTDGIFALVRELRRDVAVPMVFMTYANVVFSYGTQRFLSACSEAGIDGLILPDLPFEEKEEFLPDCRRYGVALISLIAPTSENRIAMIAREAEGFVYLVSSLGVTGTRCEITTDLAAIVRVIRENTNVPCAIGFGISTPEQAKRMAALSDGAIVGSAIVRLVETYGKDSPPHVGEYVKQMKNAMLTG